VTTGSGGDGTGLAEYSNQNFFTPKNNFGNTNYNLPPNSLGAYSTSTETSADGFTFTYLVYNGRRVTRQGAFNAFLPAGYLGTYTLDRSIFDDMAGDLLPRAVAHSAGLLDFFYRGKLQISLPDEGVYGIVDHATSVVANGDLPTNNSGFNKIKLKLSAPQTGYDDQMQQFGGGTVVAVLKFRRSLCSNNNAAGNFDLSGMQGLETQISFDPPAFKYNTCRSADEQILVSDPANGGASVTPTTTAQALTFNFQKALPINATDVRLQIVFRGQLGPESDAVVVATQDIAEPSFFSYMNASDYYTIKTSNELKVYTRDAVNADQGLLQAVYPKSCIDTSVTPNQLKSNCLNPFDINVGFTIGNGVTVKVNAMPVRKFIRFVVLGDAGASTSLVQMATNTCYPHDPMSIDSMEWQDNAVAADNTPLTTYPDVLKVRGVYQWDGTSCVGNGSDTVPGAQDNRDDPNVMTDLPTDNLAPWPVQIDGF
jgi:hypothetical protein